MLFPTEKKASPPRTAHAADSLNSLTLTLTNSTYALTDTGCTGLAGQVSAPNADGVGWLPDATLATGQPPGLHSTVVQPALPARRTGAVSRGWWPLWHSNPTAAACTATRSSIPAPLPCATRHAPSHDAWSAADNLLDSCKYRTPPRGRAPTSPGAAAAGAGQADHGLPGSNGTPNGVPPLTPLQDRAELLRPGNGPTTHEAATLSHSDDELADLFPGLAHVLVSPSPSGTCSPQLPAAAGARPTPVAPGVAATAAAHRLSGPVPPDAAATAAAERLSLPPLQEFAAAAEGRAGLPPAEEQRAAVHARRAGTPAGDGYDAAALVQAVEFHLTMFPSLKAEVVADVLQRHADAPQTALDQLIMLQRCVDDAAATVDGELPSHSAWDSGSGSGSEDEHALGGGAGASWAQDLTPEELAALEHGMFPSDVLECQQHQQLPSAAPAGGAGGLSREEQLAALKREFGSMPDRELAEALGACDGDLFAAAELLRSFAAEDAAAAVGVCTAGLDDSTLLGSSAGVAATVPTPVALDSALPGLGGAAALPQHVGPKVQHLARRFPGAPAESLQVALAAADNDLVAARRTLRENGYTEVEAAPSPAASTARLAPPPGLALPQPLRQSRPPQPVPLPLQGAAQAASAPPALPSLSEATYQRNQSIFDEERAHANRLQAAYRRCFALAQEKHAAGEHETAAELHMKGHEYKQQYEEERRKASRRISMRINQAAGGGLPVISVDLHCAFVHEALETVESGIRNLPESIPGGVVVRYITGKGLHSAEGKARIKPEVIALLQQRGVPYREGPGWVEATLLPVA